MGILGQLLGGLASGSNASPGSAGALESLLVGQQPGGLAGLIERFAANGLGDAVQSWIGSGPNQPVEPDQVEQALGSEHIDALAARTNLPRDTLLQIVAEHLPALIDRMTPHGRLPGAIEPASGSGSRSEEV
jgi:uncharacterized protein YidB (DUF937 family)